MNYINNLMNKVFSKPATTTEIYKTFKSLADTWGTRVADRECKSIYGDLWIDKCLEVRGSYDKANKNGDQKWT